MAEPTNAVLIAATEANIRDLDAIVAVLHSRLRHLGTTLSHTAHPPAAVDHTTGPPSSAPLLAEMDDLIASLRRFRVAIERHG